ncbi:amidase [Acuticoccus sp.]|uniref:amidase n=1 Tax=Acuticoccus sp. TaxID=1904378 RepID=UPI003B52BEBF
MSALHHLTIAEASTRIAERSLSPVELTEAVLRQIEARNDTLNAYVHVDADGAMASAKAAEADVAAGRHRGPLHGIPIGLKDIYDTADMPTTCHSNLFKARRPREDAHTVALLRDAGAVILGKLATHEFAFGGPSWDIAFPPARNPWNTDHFTGGSSSGSGAAVAAGLALGAMGSDTAGSIRMPAHFCGLAGIKPTYGLASRRGVSPLAYSLDHCGPLTWTTRDCALMLQATAGHDPADPASAKVEVPDYAAALTGDIAGLKVGLIRHFYEADASATPEVRAAMDAAVATLGELGAAVEEVQLSPLQDYHACNFVILLAEALAIHEDDLAESPELYGEIMRDRLYLATQITGADYVQATRMRQTLCAELAAVLARCDVVVTAGGLLPAPELTAIPKFYLLETPFITSPFNVTGSPAHTVCIGFSDEGLPMGMQIAGRPFEDATVLKVGDAYERATPWRDRRPS